MNRGDVVTVAAAGDYGKPRPAVIVQTDALPAAHASVVAAAERGGRRAMRKGLGFPMGDFLVQTLAHDRGIAGRTIGLPACLDRCHDGFGGDMEETSRSCLLYVSSANAKLP
jgi:hypothetical protein